jgi:Ca2+-binding RTX toxin-like protein
MGGSGDDVLWGKSGKDVLIGGTGADEFHCGQGFDIILDFDKFEGDTKSKNCEIF